MRHITSTPISSRRIKDATMYLWSHKVVSIQRLCLLSPSNSATRARFSDRHAPYTAMYAIAASVVSIITAYGWALA